MADFSTEKIVTQHNHTQSKKHLLHSFWRSRKIYEFLLQMLFSLASSPSQSKPSGFARFPLLSLTRHLPPAGGSRPSKGEPLAVHADFISLPRPLPLGEVSPQVTERARLLTVCSNLPYIKYQRSRSRPLPSCKQTAHSPWWRGGRHPRRTPPSSSGS